MERLTRRRLKDLAVRGIFVLCAAVVLVPLISVITFVAVHGISALSGDFLTSLPKPVGEAGGGIGNALVGTVVLLGLGSVFGLPVGLLAGMYLAEFGDNRVGHTVRFVADILLGVPSIVVGIIAYTLVVLPQRHFSALAGGVALGMMMVPIVTRTTEEMLRTVPSPYREAALALGIPAWRTTLSVVLPTAAGGVITGIMLALARVAGETAPLLFTAFNNHFWSRSVAEPTASLTVQIFTYAISPFDEWHRQAWGAALILLALMLLINIGARWASRERFGVTR